MYKKIYESPKSDTRWENGTIYDPHDGKLADEATIVASRNAVTDGLFVEAKEGIAGFFIIRAYSLEQAVEVAKGCPGLDYGQTVEVRPIVLDDKILDWRENLSKLG